MKKLILIGAGGHSKVIQDIVTKNNDLELYAIIDDAFDITQKSGGLIYSNPSLLRTLKLENFSFCIAIGENTIRKKMFDRLKVPFNQYMTIIDPSAVISESAKIGKGTVIMPNVVINANTTVGKHCIINSGAVVEHDNVLDDYVHISPNATLAGAVNIGKGSHIGSGAVVIPDKRVGQWTTVGAGSVLVNDTGSEVIVIGVPGKVVK